MNYFNETEKSLKRYLKSKVSITMATVVGFLIAGSVSFGADGAWVDAPTEIGGTINVSASNADGGKWEVSVVGSTENKKTGGSDWYGQGVSEESLKKENNTVTFVKGKDLVLNSVVNKSANTPAVVAAINGVTKGINEGNIWVTGNGYGEAMEGAWNVKTELENKGNIYVDGKLSAGIGVNPGVSAVNSGNIYVKEGSGIKINGGTVAKAVDNIGKIYVDGENAVGINYYNTGVADSESIKNSGLIQVGEGKGVVITTGEKEKSFENTESGIIKVTGKGTGIEVGWGSTFVNNGTVDGGSNGQGILVNVGNATANSEMKVENNGNIYGAIGITEGGTNGTDASTSSVVVENNGDIKTTSKGVSWNGYYTKYSSFEVNNNKNITVEGDNATQGIYVASRPDAGKGVIKNNGKITVINTDDDLENPYHTGVIGIRVHENTEGYNGKDGVIVVSGNRAAGVAVTGGSIESSQVTDENKAKYSYFKNEGTIDVSGKESVGLLVRHDYTGSLTEGTDKVSVAATNLGSIKASGEGAIGVKLTHFDLEKASDDMNLVNLKFTNEGTIEATGEGAKAIYSEIDGLTINLAGNSHIVGTVDLTGAKNNTIDIDGVGLNKQETITVSGDDDNLVVNNSNVVVEGKLTNSEGTAISVNNKTGDNTVVNNATIVAETGIQVMDKDQDTSSNASGRVISITNNGDITAKYYGISNNGYYTKHNGINITNNGNILVNDFIKDEDSYDIPYYYTNGIYQASATYTKTAGVVKNNGKVEVDLTSEQNAELKAKYEETKGNMYLNIHGVRLHEHSEGYNTGDIIVNAYGGNGVVLSAGDTGANSVEEFKTRYNYFENSGNIAVTGENGIGVSLKNTTEAKMEAINDSTGVITVNGDNAIAVKVNGNATFTNIGKLVLGEEGDNKKAIVLENDGDAKNNGIVQILGKELEGVNTKDEALSKIFVGDIENNGLIVDKDGHALFVDSGDTTITDDTTTDVIGDLAANEDSLTLEGDITLSGGVDNPVITTDVLNVVGGATTIASGSEVNLEVENINLDAGGKLSVSKDATLGLTNGILNKAGEDRTAIDLSEGGALNLVGMEIHGDIVGENGVITVSGDNKIDGKVEGEFNIGNVVNEKLLGATVYASSRSGKTSTTVMTSTSSFGNTVNIGSDSQLVLELGKDYENALSNSEGITVNGDGIADNGDIALDTSNFSGKEATISLGEKNSFVNVDVTTTLGDNSIYTVDDSNLSTNKNVTLTYNQDLYKDNSTINDMNKEAYNVNNYFSQDKATREKQLDTLHTNSIYSETVRAAYDAMKQNEETVLSLNADTKVGEWAAAGKAMYDKTKYDRTGTLGEYSSEIETSGLMAGLEYGINDTMSVGVAFSGAYQDIDVDGGSADGNVFYLGTYAKKQVGKLSLIAGIGYQYGDYDADNTAGEKSSSASYDVNAYSAYVEGRYGVDLGDNVTFEPKLKLGYTYVDQENVSDDYFRLSNGELSTFDTEIGADLVKSVALKSGKLDVRFGASYVRAFGDTDDKFTGSFAGSTGSFDVLGAELSENTGKFDLSVEVNKDNGVFYNVGGTLRVGSDNTRDYGVKVGAGYKF